MNVSNLLKSSVEGFQQTYTHGASWFLLYLWVLVGQRASWDIQTYPLEERTVATGKWAPGRTVLTLLRL